MHGRGRTAGRAPPRTATMHGRAPGCAGRAWLLPPVHGRASLQVGRALSFSAIFRSFSLIFIVLSHLHPFPRHLFDLELFPAKHK